MRLLVEEILDDGKKALRVDLASVDRCPVAAGDAVWLLADDGTRRRRTLCVDVRVLVTASGVAAVVDVVDATNQDLLVRAWNERNDSSFAPRGGLLSEDVAVTPRSCACGNEADEAFEHGAARCSLRRPAPPPTPPPPTKIRVVRASEIGSGACACGAPTRPGYRHGAESCTREDVATIADLVAEAKDKDKVTAAPALASVPARAPEVIKFIAPPGAPDVCPTCGERYRHVEHMNKPGVIMMSFCKCNLPPASTP